jgi:E3 Ubiquitin ligase
MLQVAILLPLNQRLMIWPAVGILIGIHGFVLGFRVLKRRRLILNTPASKIRSASMGLVEISGMATGPHVVTSPLKQVECYYYRSTAWHLKQSGKSSKWVEVADERLHLPFYVDDSTEKLLIDPSGAGINLHCDFHEEYQPSASFQDSEIPLCVQEFLLRHGVSSTARIKVEEYCIKPDDFLFVLGTLSQNPGVDMSVTPPWASRAGYSRSAPNKDDSESSHKIIRLSTESKTLPLKEMTQQQRVAAALAKAGMFATPWHSGISQPKPCEGSLGSAAAVEEKRVPFDPNYFDLHPPVVMMKGASEPAFFISWRSQRDVVHSLGWKSALMIWGSPALVLACVYFLLEHLH